MNKCSKRFQSATMMPPLRHKIGLEYDQQNSEVINWLLSQPEIREYVFRRAESGGLIVFNKTTRTWQGRDWKGYTF